MNKGKALTGFLVLGLVLCGAASALGGKLPAKEALVVKAKFRPHAVEISAAEPAGPGMPCREVRRWSKVTTFSGCDADAPANRVEPPSANAKTFLSAHKQALALRPDLADLKVAKVKSGLSRNVIRYQQTFGNYPVLDAFVSTLLRPSGRVTTIHTSYISDPVMVGAATPVIARKEAEAIAIEGIRQLSGVSSPKLLAKTSAEVSWLPVGGQSVTLVWVVKTQTSNPWGNFYTLVDANTGKRLRQNNQIVSAVGTGMVYAPNPIQTSGFLGLTDNDDATDSVLDGQRIDVPLLGLADGTTLLKGEFVDLTSSKTPTCPRLDGQCPDADNVSRAYVYSREQPEFEQVMVYNAVDSVQRYLLDLGFQDAQDKATIRNFPTLASAHWDAEDNSLYSPFADALYFGDGGVDDAEDADIIVHEFGHAIQHDQNSVCFPGGDYIPQANEAGAMGEGFSDYLAASFFAKNVGPALDAACIGEWDSTSYRDTKPSCLRRVDSRKHYPDDLSGEVHADGEIWSAALWDIRPELGARSTDQLVVDHHFNLDCSNGITMPQAALVMIDTTADANVKGILRRKFCKHGILVGSACESPIESYTVVSVEKDSTLVKDAPNRNEGASPELRLGSGKNTMRIVLAFDPLKVKRGDIDTARLVMTVQDNPGAWGRRGLNVAARPLKAAGFPEEGNGRWLGVSATLRTAGRGKGVTWKCYTDNNISNNVKDCSIPWNGGTSNFRTSAPFVHTNELKIRDEVSWDVTDDVKDGATAWLVKKGNEGKSGQVVYFAKEGNPALAPRLEITFTK
jgi:hypothetical protein